jgi:glucosylceramidase
MVTTGRPRTSVRGQDRLPGATHTALRCHGQRLLTGGLVLLISATLLLSDEAAAVIVRRTQIVETTAYLSRHLSRLPPLTFSPARAVSPAEGLTIHVDDTKQYQTFQGEGAAMTDSSASLLSRLPRRELRNVMRRLFGAGPGSAHISELRLPMGASDFTASGEPYTYDDRPPGQVDPALTHFSIGHDRKYIIPLLRLARHYNRQLQVEAVPWTAPPWMKSNDAFGNRFHQGSLLKRFYAAYASYFVKFIRAYARAGITINSIVPQNEPDVATRYPGMQLLPDHEALFIVNYLQPALKAAGLDTKIYGDDLSWDKNRYASIADARNVGSVLNRIAGNSYHCYRGSSTLMSAIHRQYPKLDERMDECSPGVIPNPAPEVMLAALRNYASTVMLWNLALDPAGGPVEPPNTGCQGCTGLITISPQTHRVTYSQAYYQLGQIGDFVERGARRISTNHFVRYGPGNGVWGPRASRISAGLDDVGFENPNGTDVLVAYNNGLVARRFKVRWNNGVIAERIGPGDMETFVWRR